MVADGMVADGMVADGMVADGMVADGMVADGMVAGFSTTVFVIGTVVTVGKFVVLDDIDNALLVFFSDGKVTDATDHPAGIDGMLYSFAVCRVFPVPLFRIMRPNADTLVCFWL